MAYISKNYSQRYKISKLFFWRSQRPYWSLIGELQFYACWIWFLLCIHKLVCLRLCSCSCYLFLLLDAYHICFFTFMMEKWRNKSSSVTNIHLVNLICLFWAKFLEDSETAYVLICMGFSAPIGDGDQLMVFKIMR